ncbi:MAG: hypothetical protein WCO60_11280 [Verrucomicrobiota bacterium]
MRYTVLLAIGSCLSAHAADMEWVTVGNPGNLPDKTGYGAVAYEYQIGKYEVTVEQYAEFLNAVNATDAHKLWDKNMEDPSLRVDHTVF